MAPLLYHAIIMLKTSRTKLLPMVPRAGIRLRRWVKTQFSSDSLYNRGQGHPVFKASRSRTTACKFAPGGSADIRTPPLGDLVRRGRPRPLLSPPGGGKEWPRPASSDQISPHPTTAARRKSWLLFVVCCWLVVLFVCCLVFGFGCLVCCWLSAVCCLFVVACCWFWGVCLLFVVFLVVACCSFVVGLLFVCCWFWGVCLLFVVFTCCLLSFACSDRDVFLSSVAPFHQQRGESAMLAPFTNKGRGSAMFAPFHQQRWGVAPFRQQRGGRSAMLVPFYQRWGDRKGHYTLIIL